MSTSDEGDSDGTSGGTGTYAGQPLTRSYDPVIRANAQPQGSGFRANASRPIRTFETEPGRVDLGMADKRDHPSVWSAVGYPKEEQFEFDSFWVRYERQSEARAIIDRPVDDSWQDRPEIRDEANDDTDESLTAFEEAVEDLFEGEHTRRKPVHRLSTADKLGRLGEYSIVVIGTDDGRDLDTPLAGADGEGESEFAGTPDAIEDLHYIATFGQDRIIGMEIETEMSSPRFRLPREYEVVTQDASDPDLEDGDVADEHKTQTVHWSRVLHVPEGELEDDLRGTPALKPVFHELLNIDKIRAASGEGYWRAGYQGLVITPPVIGTGRDARQADFANGGDDVKDEIDRFLANMDRSIATTGEVTPINQNVADPTPHLEINYRGIEVALGIPRSVFAGEDRADTADAQNATEWDTKVAGRQNNHNGPVILEPFLQRLIDVGLLPEPEGSGFRIEWPDRQELTEKQQADVLNATAQAMSRASGGTPDKLWTVPELRAKFDDHPERGMEVDEEFQPDEDEELEIDEERLRRMQEQMDRPLPGEMRDQQPPGGGSASGDDDPEEPPGGGGAPPSSED